ncbi:MAG: hypothetical protein P8H05_01405 [Schleiferiaceae bacterium]|nr:hypothetical protein [Schleiferiaceae bacterium]
MNERPTELFVFGYGGAFKEISKLISEDNLFEIIVVLQSNYEELSKSLSYRTIEEEKFFELYEQKEVCVGIFIGDFNIRKKLVKLIKSKLKSVVFPSFNFTKYLEGSTLKEGNWIMPGCIFTDENIDIGSFNYFNFSCFIAHDVQIDSFNTFSPFVKVSGNCKITSNNFFGTGCILFPGITVDNTSIGAGAVVKKKKLIGQIVNIPQCDIYNKR